MSTNDTPAYRSVADLDAPVAEALLQWALALADAKHLLGRRLSEWAFGGAPALEAAVGAAAMTQDELGHARSLFSMLREFPGAPPELGTETDLDRTEYFNPRLLDAPWESWLDVVAVNVLLDRALAVVFAAARQSAFAPLGQRTAKILQEEHYHRVFGDSWLGRLAARGDETRARLQASLQRVWPTAAAWFGPPDDDAVAKLNQAGIVRSSPAVLREKWAQQASAVLEKHGLVVPAGELDWSRWDARRREVANGS